MESTKNSIDVKLELKKAWMDKRTSIYLSKNWREIRDYLYERGMILKKEEIRQFLALQKTEDLVYKNYGKIEIASLGKNFVQRPKFFANLHCDSMVLSKKRKYGTRNNIIMVIIDQLSRWIFLESCLSTKWIYQKRGWENVFKKLEKLGYGKAPAVIYHDAGVEYENAGFKAWIRERGIKDNVIRSRPFRMSKGSPYAESSIRRIRMHLEENTRLLRGQGFDKILGRIENQCNTEKLCNLGMSAKEALNHDPNYVMLQSESLRWRRNKGLRKEVANQSEIKLKTVVKIKKNLDKEFNSVSKESYGHLSKTFVVKSVDKTRAIWTYCLADLFTLKCIDGSYSRAELICLDIDFINACHKESENVKKIIGVEKGIVMYNIEYNDLTYCANESLVIDTDY